MVRFRFDGRGRYALLSTRLPGFPWHWLEYSPHADFGPQRFRFLVVRILIDRLRTVPVNRLSRRQKPRDAAFVRLPGSARL